MCDRHRELLDIYQNAVARYSATLEALKMARTSPSKQDYDRHYGYVEQARIKAEQARLDLETHIAEHGCVLLDMGPSVSTNI